MGKIKSKPIRRAVKTLTKEGVQFSDNFEKNKKILVGLVVGKKVRNQIAGLLAKTKKAEISKMNSK